MNEQKTDDSVFVTTLAHAAADPFRLLVEAVKDYGIFMLDQAGNVTSWNPGAEKIKGYNAQEIIGKHFSCFYTNEDVKSGKPQEGLRIALEEERFEEEGWRKRKDDTTFLAIVTITNIHDSFGKHIGFANVTRDISEGALGRAAVRASELRYRRLFESAKDGIIILDGNTGQIVDANAFVLDLLGYLLPELLGKKLCEIGFFKDAQANEEAFSQLQKQEYIRYDDLLLRTKEGQSHQVEFVSNVYDVGDDRVIQCNIRDITRRKKAEEMLHLRDQAIESFVQAVVITASTQPDNPIIYVNDSFSRITGYSREEVIGKNCRFLQGPKTSPEAVERIRSSLKEGLHCLIEVLNYRKDGTPFWNGLAIWPIRDATGSVTHFVGVQTDLTPIKSLEQQFRQAQKMEAIGTLAGGVAHDFNNLLTVINGYSEMLMNQLSHDDPMRSLLLEIYKAGERAGNLTRQLLAFSRKQLLEPKVLNLNAIVLDTETMFRRLIGEDIILAIVLDPGLKPVRADLGQIQQVLMNLAVNARDAMPQGGQLTIETRHVVLDDRYHQTHSQTQPGEYSMLAVTDTGVGMDEATKARIFEPFFTTKGEGKGTGLGLAVVHGIVRQSGGEIEVYSELGKGTAFRVYFPLEKEAWVAGKPTGIMKMPEGTETILLVEDEDAVRALSRHILQSCGYTVLEATNGLEAIRVAEDHKEPIHLVVSDVVMPLLGGRQLAEQLEAMRPGLKILFLSGYTDDAVIRHGILQADFAFLQKPFSPSALAQKVRNVLDQTA